MPTTRVAAADSLIAAVHEPPIPTAGGHRLPAAQLSPPGLFAELSIVVEAEWWWQYQHYSLLFFVRDGVRYVYVPDPSARTRLDSLPCYRADQVARWLPVARARFHNEPSPNTPPDVDAAPWIAAGLAHFVATGDRAGLALGLGVLDLLAVFRGYGSDNVRASQVYFGATGVARLAAELPGGAVPDDARDAVLAAEVRGRGGAYRVSVDHLTFVAERHEQRDSQVGGYDRELVLGSLAVAPWGLHYERRVLFAQHEDGDEKS